MSESAQRIFIIDDLKQGVFPGSITITNTERLNIWHQNVGKKFKKVIGNCTENQLNFLIGEYKRLIQDQCRWICDKSLFRDKIIDHLFILYLTHRRLENKQLIRTTVYLDYTEKFLILLCDLELQTLNGAKPDKLMESTQRMISVLQILLCDDITRVLHILLKISDQYTNKQMVKKAMNVLFKYFMVNFPIRDTEGLTFCLHYLLYQRWSKFKSGSVVKSDAMIKLLLYKFKSSYDIMKCDYAVRVILDPNDKDTNFVIDMSTESMASKVLKYFKLYEEIKQSYKRPCQKDTEELEWENYYRIDYVGITFFKSFPSTRINQNTSRNMPMVVDGENEVIVIEDDDSDVEIVPLNQDTNETLANEVSLNVSTAIPEEPLTALNLIHRFNSINITSKKHGMQDEFNVSTNFMLDQIDVTSTVDNIIDKLLNSYFARPVVAEKQLTMQDENKLDLQIQENDSELPCLVEVHSTTTNGEAFNKTKNLVVRQQASELESCPLEPSIGNMSCEKVQITKHICDGMHTNEAANNNCNYCGNKEQIVIIQSLKEVKITEFSSKPDCRNARIETDNAEMETNNAEDTVIMDFRSTLKTPPSDLENYVSPSRDPIIFNYFEDSHYSQKNVDSETQSCIDNINNGGEKITTTLQETLSVLKPVSLEAAISSRHEFIADGHKDLKDKPCVLLLNDSLGSDDISTKMPVLEPELTASLNSEEHLNSNNVTAIVTKHEVILNGVKKKTNGMHKKAENKDLTIEDTYGATTHSSSPQNASDNADLVDGSKNIISSDVKKKTNGMHKKAENKTRTKEGTYIATTHSSSIQNAGDNTDLVDGSKNIISSDVKRKTNGMHNKAETKTHTIEDTNGVTTHSSSIQNAGDNADLVDSSKNIKSSDVKKKTSGIHKKAENKTLTIEATYGPTTRSSSIQNAGDNGDLVDGSKNITSDVKKKTDGMHKKDENKTRTIEDTYGTTTHSSNIQNNGDNADLVDCSKNIISSDVKKKTNGMHRKVETKTHTIEDTYGATTRSSNIQNAGDNTDLVNGSRNISNDVKKKTDGVHKKAENKTRTIEDAGDNVDLVDGSKNISSDVKKKTDGTHKKAENKTHTIKDTCGATTHSSSSQNVGNNADLVDGSKNILDSAVRELSPSPAYEVIPTHELRKHFREVKRGRKANILKVNGLGAHEDVDSSNNFDMPVQQKSSRSTRAAPKRKCNTHMEVSATKNSKLNFSNSDIIVHIPKEKEQQRRISYSIVEQARDSMFLHNIHKQDNKLIYLEPCVPITILPFSKYLEEHKVRQINSYNKNLNNIFFNKGISFTSSPGKINVQRVDYNKIQKGDTSSPSSTIKYSTITFHPSYESAEGSTQDPMDCADAEQCNAKEIIQNAVIFYTNSNLACDLDLPLFPQTYKTLTKQLLDNESKNSPADMINRISRIEVRMHHYKSSFDKYQEKEMPLKKRKVFSTSSLASDGSNLVAENLTNPYRIDKRVPIKTNAFPANIEIFLVLDNAESSNNAVPTSSENITQNNSSDPSIVNPESYKEVENYPAGPVLSIAEVQEEEHLQNRTFKTPAERKEFPSLSSFRYTGDPNTIFPENSAPIIADQFNVNNHTYNNPTINYHMGNLPLPYYNYNIPPYYHLAPPYILPYNTVQLDSSSTSNPSSYNDVVKPNNNVPVDNTQTASVNVKKERKIH